MADLKRHKLGWIGIGRMGFPMAERLLKKGCDLAVYNRTRAKAEPLAAQGARIVDSPAALADRDIVFTMVSASDDLKQVTLGKDGVLAGAGKAPKILIDCSTVSEEASLEVREVAAKRGTQMLASPVSGNGNTNWIRCVGKPYNGELKGLVADRRQYFDHRHTQRGAMPKVLGTIPEAVEDPILIEIFGLNPQSIKAVQSPDAAGAHGVRHGKRRGADGRRRAGRARRCVGRAVAARAVEERGRLAGPGGNHRFGPAQVVGDATAAQRRTGCALGHGLVCGQLSDPAVAL